MVKITVNTDTVNNNIPTTILLDKATTNNSLDEEEIVRVELGGDEKVKEEAVLVEEELDEEEDGTMKVEESALKRLDRKSTKLRTIWYSMVFYMLKSLINMQKSS